MDKIQNKDEWKELLQQAMEVARKQTKKFESKLTKESRKAIIEVEVAARAETKRAKANILKLAAGLESNGKKTIRAILNGLEKDKTTRKAPKTRKAAKSGKSKKK